MNRPIVGVALFVGVILIIHWIPDLKPAYEPWRVATEAVKQSGYHWAVIPLGVLAVAGAVLAIFRGHGRRLFNLRIMGVAVFAGAMVVLQLNPGLSEATFNPDWAGSHGSPWLTSYHWGLIPLIVVGVAGAAAAVMPDHATINAIQAANRQVIGLLVFAGAFFVLHNIPGLILRQGRVVEGEIQETVIYHWGVVPIVLLTVAGAALAVWPSRKTEATFDRTNPRFATCAAWSLAGYPFVLVVWFYLYVLRQRVVLGYWPRPNHPDPKQAGMNFHHESIPYLFDLVPIVALGAISLIVALRDRNPNFRWRGPIALWAGALGVLIVLVKFDPGYFIDWWLD